VNCTGRIDDRISSEYRNKGIELLLVDAEDEEDYPMLEKHLEEVHVFVKDLWRQGKKNVLIHCAAGINRSGVLVAAIKMRTERLPILDVVSAMRLRRGNLCITNEGFQRELLVLLADSENLLGPIPGSEGSRFAIPPPPPLPLDDLATKERKDRKKRPARALDKLF